MGKRRRFPDIEQDRDIQTREDKLGFLGAIGRDAEVEGREEAAVAAGKKLTGCCFRRVGFLPLGAFVSINEDSTQHSSGILHNPKLGPERKQNMAGRQPFSREVNLAPLYT
ncbi:hypothetical protein D5086_013255 [Populus alba]|uniref:Uncharacterized protein n=1 Tax=Populus alba TaxID=43335 RepID=A0ACC4C5D2_POPAL